MRWLFCSLLMLLPAVVQAGRDIVVRGRTYDVARLGPDQLSSFSLAERRIVGAYLIEYGVHYYDERKRRKLIEALEEGGDPFLNTLAAVGKAYFFNRSLPGRISELELYKRQNLQKEYLDYHIALLELSQGRPLQSQALTAICSLPAENASCRMAHFLATLEGIKNRPQASISEFKQILAIGQTFLEGQPVFPPFFRLQARRIAEDLFRVGLPLEAALLADRISSGEQHFEMAELQRRIPIYLAGSGDFASAARFAERTQPASTLLDLVRLDWLILAGEYNEALNLIAARGPERLIRPGYVDYWTRFAVSAEGNRLKAAMLLYLSGQTREAAHALEKIKDFKGKTPDGEPEALFARLRLVQIIMRDNPGLAQKIAEDVSYEAQEHGWDILEYQATVLDGWARYFQREYYRATINFQKARGIVKGEKRRYISDYSRLLGDFAARRAMAPQGNYRQQIAALNAFLQSHPYHESIYILRDWLVRGLGPEFLSSEVAQSHQARRDLWGALNAFLEFERVAELFFQPGRNPGGFRGFDTSLRWSQAAAEMQAVKSLLGDVAPLYGAVQALGRQRQAEPGRVHVQPQHLAAGTGYLFSFVHRSGRALVLAQPGGRGHSISMEELNKEQVGLLAGCKSGRCRAPGPALLGGISGQTLLVQYSADFDPDWQTLAGLRQRPVYFVHATQRPGTRPVSLEFLAPAGCATVPGFRSRQVSFDALNASGDIKPAIWLWPETLDRQQGNRGERPVYLRNFICGRSSLRFWDLDRFHTRAGPGLLIYRARQGEEKLDQAFARHFAERGSMLLEVRPGWSATQAGELAALLRQGNRAELVELASRSALSSQMRLILPDMFD